MINSNIFSPIFGVQSYLWVFQLKLCVHFPSLQDSAVGTMTWYGLDSLWFKPQQVQDFPD